MDILNLEELFSVTCGRYDVGNDGREAYSLQGYMKNSLARVKGKRWWQEFRLCIVRRSVVTVRKEFPFSLVVVSIFFEKGVDSFEKLMSGCGFLGSL